MSRLTPSQRSEFRAAAKPGYKFVIGAPPQTPVPWPLWLRLLFTAAIAIVVASGVGLVFGIAARLYLLHVH